MMNWHYIDGPRRVGPFDDSEWAELVRTGKVGPDTLVWHEELSGWVALRTLPPPLISLQENEDDFELQEEIPVAEDPEAFAARSLESDYTVPIRACLSRGYHLFRENFWMLLGSTLLTWILISVGNGLPSLLALVMPLTLKGVLEGGLYSIYLRLLRREPVSHLDLFSGFESDVFWHLAKRTLYGAMIGFGCLSAASAALNMAGFEAISAEETDPTVISERLNAFFAGLDSTSLFAVLLALLVCALPFLYFKICWMFAIPLIWDKRLPCSVALNLSRRKVLQHPWRIAAIVITAAAVASIPGFTVSILYTIVSRVISVGAGNTSMLAVALLAMILAVPLYIGTLLSLYESIFTAKPATVPSGEERKAVETAEQPE